MDREAILIELKGERDRVSHALAMLESQDFSPVKSVAIASSNGAEKRGRNLTPAGRKRLSKAMKKRWAERRRKNS